jgi:hypothetical protein
MYKTKYFVKFDRVTLWNLYKTSACNIEAHSRNHDCREKATIITYSESVPVALVFRHAIRMRCVTLSFVASMALPYFSTLSRKSQDFRKNAIEHQMCTLIFPTTFV